MATIYELGCADACPTMSGSGRFPKNKTWENKGTVFIFGTQVLNLKAQFKKCDGFFPGSLSFTAYPVDGSGTTYTVADGDAGFDVTYAGTDINGSVTFATSFGIEAYTVNMSWVDSKGEAQTISNIAVIQATDTCNPENVELTATNTQFDVTLCNIDVCSLGCDNTAVQVDGTNIGYFDETGQFVATADAYKGNEYLAIGYIESTGAFLSINPGLTEGTTVQIVVLGETYSLNQCGPNACGYYV